MCVWGSRRRGLGRSCGPAPTPGAVLQDPNKPRSASDGKGRYLKKKNLTECSHISNAGEQVSSPPHFLHVGACLMGFIAPGGFLLQKLLVLSLKIVQRKSWPLSRPC